MHLLIIGIGNPTPSFIHRRLVALDRTGIDLTIAMEYGQHLDSLPNAKIVYVGGKSTMFQQFIAVAKTLLRPDVLLQLMSFRTDLKLIQRLKWAVVYFPFTRVKSPDIIHVQWLASLPEYQWLRQYFNCPFIGSARGSQVTVYPLTRPGYRAKIELAIYQADYIHCVSEDMRNRCITLGADPAKIYVNYNGINIDRFKPATRTSSSTSSLRLISVGALIWRKGFLFQLLVLKELILKGINCSFTIIGSGSDEVAIRYTAEKLGVISFLTIEGQKPEDEVLKSLQSSHIYLSTSAAEGLPNSLVEAAACGLPIVAFECEGAGEVIENEVSGFIVPFGSLQLMVDKIILLQDQNVRMKMGNYAREKMVREFDEKKWIGEMVQRYQSISSL